MAEEPEDNLPPEGEGEQGAAEGAAESQPLEGGEGEGEQPPATASEVEELAREMGWAPQDQWRGDPDQWKDAKTFLKTTVEINRSQSKELRAVKQTVERMARTTAAIADRHIREERERLTQRFYDATAENDPEAAFAAAAELQRVNAQPQDAEADPLTEFRERNAWYGSDDEATAYAASLGELHKGKPIEEQIRLVEAAVKKRFPEHFSGEAPPAATQRPQARAPMVSAPPTRSARPAPKAKTEADLPPEARKAGEDFVRRGRVGSLADYAKIYFEENA